MAEITAADFADGVPEVKKAPKLLNADGQTDDEERLGLSEEQICILQTLVKLAEDEDKSVREVLLRQYKGHHDYFRGFQDIFWDETAHDWTVPTSEQLEDIGVDDDALNRIVNIVRARGETLISALGVTPPGVKFFPDDADDEDDVSTARAYDKLRNLFLKYNDGPLILFKVLFLLYNEGIVFGHTYNETSEKYGKAKAQVEKAAVINHQGYTCPTCGESTTVSSEPQELDGNTTEAGNDTGANSLSEIPEEMPQESNGSEPEENGNQEGDSESGGPNEDAQEEAQESPEEEQQEEGQEQPEVNQEDNQQQPPMCKNCNAPMSPEGEPDKEQTKIVAEEEVDKCRQILDVYGPLNVKFPLYTKKFCEGGYLRLAFEESDALTKDKFPDIFDEITAYGGMNASASYERWARTDSQYLGQVPTDLTTVRIYWFRPWWFNKAGNPQNEDETDLKKLVDKFPKGCKVTLVGNETIAEVVEEDIDEHWSCTIDPLCNTLHADPIVKPTIPIQDVKNDVFALSVETIGHGIMETFFDAEVLDTEKYRNQRAQAGMKYPVKPRPGKSIADSFYQDKSANLSDEVGLFDERLDQTADFLVGTPPSIWGGPQSGGSKTLGEYSQSRAMALQRLGITWRKVCFFFCHMYRIAIPSLAQHIHDAGYDEKYVEESGTSFLNVWIKNAELEGKVGDITPEASEQLPTSWAQRRELMIQLIGMNNPLIQTALAAPQNATVVRDALGLDEIYIPGEDDRDKQYSEFVILLDGEASGPDENGLMVPSVPVQPWEDHKTEGAVCRSFLVSSTGLIYKKLKPKGYENIVAHMNAHEQAFQSSTAANLPHAPAGQEVPSNSASKVQ